MFKRYFTKSTPYRTQPITPMPDGGAAGGTAHLSQQPSSFTSVPGSGGWAAPPLC